jgi:hypothetical protein
MIVTSRAAAVREAARAHAAARRQAIEIGGGAESLGSSAWSSFVIGLTARLPRWRPTGVRRAAAPRGATVAAFVHTAFWKTGDTGSRARETYIGPVLDALATQAGPASLRFVGVGPRRNFRARRWWDPAGPVPADITPIERLAPAHTLKGSLDLWARREALAASVTSGEGIRAAALINGCDLWPLVRAELQDAARLQWTWSARAMDEAGAALDALKPQVALTYAAGAGRSSSRHADAAFSRWACSTASSIVIGSTTGTSPTK